MQPTEASLTPQSETIKNSTQNISVTEVVLTGAAVLDGHLEQLLKAALPGSKTQVDRLASSFNRRRQLAACTGQITPQMSRDLRLIGGIRNKFAHPKKPIDFNAHCVLSRLGELSIYPQAISRGLDKRAIFEIAVLYLTHQLNGRLAQVRRRK